ncbi:MAG TPA: hypothetical protein VE978_18930 [Chitinophagales bacterium]|nr:hypothetical protein [Chitinophagales bacterium]
MNEKLIKDVFSKMAEYKPSLQKYLIADEPGEEIDVRVLGDLIIKNFPWPIGLELRRLFSGAMRSLDRGRLDQLFKTIERTMQFLSFVMVAQLWEERLKKNIELSDEFTSQFQNRFNQLTLGNYSWLIRAISKAFSQSHTDHFIIEKHTAFNNKFFESLDFWVPERNEIGHYQINLTTEEIERRCVEYQDKLSLILQSISFFVNYKLVTMRQINVLKKKHRDPSFNHCMDLLNSSDSDFKGTEVQYQIFADSNAVLLLKDFNTPSEYLNLSPLIIDTRTEVIDQREKFSIKKDIFLYTKFQNGKLVYAGTEVTEKCDLSLLSSYPDLQAQFTELMKYILNPAVATA